MYVEHARDFRAYGGLFNYRPLLRDPQLPCIECLRLEFTLHGAGSVKNVPEAVAYYGVTWRPRLTLRRSLIAVLPKEFHLSAVQRVEVIRAIVLRLKAQDCLRPRGGAALRFSVGNDVEDVKLDRIVLHGQPEGARNIAYIHVILAPLVVICRIPWSPQV